MPARSWFMHTNPPIPRARQASSCASVRATTSLQRAHMISRFAAAPPTLCGGGCVVVGGGSVVEVVVEVDVVVGPPFPHEPAHTRTDAVGPESLSVVIVTPL